MHVRFCCRPQHAVTISSPTTGIVLEVDTTSPGLQFYSGGLLSTDAPVVGKAGAEYPVFAEYTVRTQVCFALLAMLALHEIAPLLTLQSTDPLQ